MKRYDNSFNTLLIKRTLYKMSQQLPKPRKCFGGNVNVQVNLSNYATKSDLKNAIGTDTSKLILKTDLTNLETR